MDGDLLADSLSLSLSGTLHYFTYVVAVYQSVKLSYTYLSNQMWTSFCEFIVLAIWFVFSKFKKFLFYLKRYLQEQSLLVWKCIPVPVTWLNSPYVFSLKLCLIWLWFLCVPETKSLMEKMQLWASFLKCTWN